MCVLTCISVFDGTLVVTDVATATRLENTSLIHCLSVCLYVSVLFLFWVLIVLIWVVLVLIIMSE